MHHHVSCFMERTLSFVETVVGGSNEKAKHYNFIACFCDERSSRVASESESRDASMPLVALLLVHVFLHEYCTS